MTVLRNNKALEDILSSAIDDAVGEVTVHTSILELSEDFNIFFVVKFREKAQNKNRVPRTQPSFDTSMEIAKGESHKVSSK